MNGDTKPDERFASRQVAQYKNRISQEKLGASLGNPDLVYESRLVESFEPTGVPVRGRHLLGAA